MQGRRVRGSKYLLKIKPRDKSKIALSFVLFERFKDPREHSLNAKSIVVRINCCLRLIDISC